MNDFVQKYKNAQNGTKGKVQNKNDKKQTTKALFQALKMAQDGQIAGIVHLGKKYVLLSEDALNELVRNGGRIAVTQEQKEFQVQYQILLNLMQNMNVEFEDENELFTDLDSFTFEFSDVMNGTKEARSRVSKEFKALIDGNEKLTQKYKELEPQIRQQMNPKQKQQSPENKGKLT